MGQGWPVTKLASITVLVLLTDDQIGHNVRVMAQNITASKILDRWPTRRAVYEDALKADPDLQMVAVHRWFSRGSIPGKYDAALLEGAARRGIGLHPKELISARSVHTDQSGHRDSGFQAAAQSGDAA